MLPDTLDARTASVPVNEDLSSVFFSVHPVEGAGLML